jgi:hypothetical protein
MEAVLRVAPGFKDRWREHLRQWNGKPAGLTLDMIEFADYVTRLLEERRVSALEPVFALVEAMLTEGTEEVKDAVATGFLESVVNPITEETEYLPLFIRLLGPESRAYCVEWLEFAGADLPGLTP